VIIAETVEEFRRYRAALTGRVALVPTMGALHDGHFSPIDRARELGDHVVVSIFVNPTQFNESEDYQRYPRPVEDDLRRCRERGVDAVFAPGVDQMYPPGEPDAAIDVPALTADLEGAHRPGHFQGVCRVVAKLLNIVQPDAAVFGFKDYQQLCVVHAMVRDLAMPVEIAAAPTAREPDGLARSSRNIFITPEQRPNAVGLYKALTQARMMIEQSGEMDPETVEQAMAATMKAHQLDVDYAAVRHPATLAPLDSIDPKLTGGVVALAAARLGGVRLIDNMIIGVS
jgi:pantoate--beta-alanine ligase